MRTVQHIGNIPSPPTHACDFCVFFFFCKHTHCNTHHRTKCACAWAHTSHVVANAVCRGIVTLVCAWVCVHKSIRPMFAFKNRVSTRERKTMEIRAALACGRKSSWCATLIIRSHTLWSTQTPYDKHRRIALVGVSTFRTESTLLRNRGEIAWRRMFRLADGIRIWRLRHMLFCYLLESHLLWKFSYYGYLFFIRYF